jgi:gas vesicle protein
MDRRFVDTVITVKKKDKSNFTVTNEDGLSMNIEDHDEGTNEKKVFDWLKQTTKSKVGIYAKGGEVDETSSVEGEQSISFDYKGFKHEFKFTPEEQDWWTAFQSNGLEFDVHYDEDYGDILVYEVVDGKSMVEKTIYKKKIENNLFNEGGSVGKFNPATATFFIKDSSGKLLKKTKSANAASDFYSTSGKTGISVTAIDKDGNEKIIYAKGGEIKLPRELSQRVFDTKNRVYSDLRKITNEVQEVDVEKAIKINKVAQDVSDNMPDYAQGGEVSDAIKSKIAELKEKYDVDAKPMYSDKTRLEIVTPYFNTLSEIKKKEFKGSGHIEKYGNLSSYVYYTPAVFAQGGEVFGDKVKGELIRNFVAENGTVLQLVKQTHDGSFATTVNGKGVWATADESNAHEFFEDEAAKYIPET